MICVCVVLPLTRVKMYVILAQTMTLLFICAPSQFDGEKNVT
jgi:hypothetical protein